MKDKLEKYGKERHVYRLRSVALLALLVAGAAMAAMIPIGISYRMAEARAVEAPQTSLSLPA